jgi:hypothetical protein
MTWSVSELISEAEPAGQLLDAIRSAMPIELGVFSGIVCPSTRADATCPVSTSFFLRTVAEAAWDELEGGKSTSEVAPFWRVVDPKSPLAKAARGQPLDSNAAAGRAAVR